MRAANQSYLTIAAVLEAIQNGESSAQAVVRSHLAAAQELNGDLNAYNAFDLDAVRKAQRLDSVNAAKTLTKIFHRQIHPSQRGPLHGVPVGMKDGFQTAGIATSFGSIACADYVPSEDATLVRKLKEAGVIIVGKTTMPDWGTNFFSTSSRSQISSNPYDLSRDTGGSSSGSGSAVAANTAIFSIGSDTGGSIRLPSSFKGLVGVRMTPGRISRHGMSPLVPSQDSPGPLAHTVKDCARVLDVIVGFDQYDPWSSVNVHIPLQKSFTQAIESPSLRGRRLGVARHLFGSHPGIRALMDEALDDFSRAGAELIDVTFPSVEHYLNSTIHYQESKALINAFFAEREQLSHLKLEEISYHELLGLLKDDILKAPQDPSDSPALCRALLEVPHVQNAVASPFATYELDTIVYPTAQALPPKHADIFSEKITPLGFPTNTLIAAQLCWPAMSIPVGKTRDDVEHHSPPELPVGIEVLGLPLREEHMLSVGAGVEAARNGM